MSDVLPLHTDFVSAFREGARFRLPDGDAEMRPCAVGRLEIVSGQIVACDPLTLSGVSPFTQKIADGTYAVDLAVAMMANGDQRVAAARVTLGEGAVARWSLATAAGQDPSELAPGAIFGYGVDSGTGCFADAGGAPSLAEAAVQEDLTAGLRETYVDTWSWAEQELERGGVVAFSSGFGDGHYASFWGWGAGGELLCLVTDFCVLVESVTDDVFVDGAPGLPLGPVASPALKRHGVAVTRVPADPITLPGGPVGELAFEVMSRGWLVAELVDGTGARVPVPSCNTDLGDRRVSTFPGGLPPGTRLKVSVPLGVRPLVPIA